MTDEADTYRRQLDWARNPPAAAVSSPGVFAVDWSDPPAFLYRLHAEDGILLYIGRTRNLMSRLAGHERDQAWGAEVLGMTAQLFARESDAKRAEVAAIAAESPLHNVVGRPRGKAS